MRQIIWIVILVTGSTVAYGQRTEFSVQAGSGLFSFRGPGATGETGLIGNDTPPFTVPRNPYGRNSGLSYSIVGQVQRIATSKFVYGIRAGFESLTSRVAIMSIMYPIDYGSPSVKFGQATLRNRYINLHPFVGRRFGNQRVSLDVTVGVDIGFGLSSHEHSELRETTGYFTTTDRDRPIPTVDLRPRLNVTGYYRAFGLSLGYSHGLTKYTNISYSDNRIYARMWRVGVVYRLSHRA